jgi:uncharacterized protein (DUF849 family)
VSTSANMRACTASRSPDRDHAGSDQAFWHIRLAAGSGCGHVRVGMEDNLYISKGVLAKTNAELVTHAANILRSLGATIASATETRAMLGLS